MEEFGGAGADIEVTVWREGNGQKWSTTAMFRKRLLLK
jgi:hypothetical protein